MEQRTILFVDQVGSTRQLAEIGDAAMVAIRRRLWAIVNAAAVAHSGRVFSDEGDGGALAFDRQDDAIDAVLAIVANAHDERIALRAGLHSGQVIPNGDGFVGLAVHTAARLCESAPSGHILTTEADAAHSSGRARFTEFGQRTLKGFVEPVAVLLLTDSLAARPPVAELLAATVSEPLPPSPLLHTGVESFVGRSTELEQLRKFPDVSVVGADGIATLLIDGDPGAGKSALAHRRCRELADLGVLCLVGRADDGLDDPLHEVIEPLEHLVRHAPTELLADHVLRHGDLLTRLIPGLGDRVPSAARRDGVSAPAPDRRAIFDAVADLLDAASRLQPIVLLIEDIHWASSPTVAILRQLMTGRPLPGVSLVVTYRPTDVVDGGAAAGFLAKSVGRSNVSALHVEPLTCSEIESLVGAHLPAVAAARPDLVSMIAKHIDGATGGNALFCAEVLRNADIDAVSAASADDLADTLTLPDSVQDLARRRVDQLGPSVVDVLADASILGESFGTLELFEMHGDQAIVLDALDRAERSALIRPDDASGRRFRFGHALVQNALAARLTMAARMTCHRRAADAIAAVNAAGSRAAERLGHLLGAGVLATPDEVVAAAELAAADATERLALPEAVTFRRIAVDALVDASDRDAAELAWVWWSLGLAQTAASSATGGASMVRAATWARTAGAWDLLGEIAVSYGGAVKENQALDDVSEPIALITEALEHHADATSMRARLLMSLALWLRQSTPYAERRALVDEAIEIASSIGDERTTAAVLAEWHRALHGPNVAAEAIAIADRLDGIAASLNDATIRLQATNLRLLFSVESGNVETAERAALRLAEIATQSRGFEAVRLHLMWTASQSYFRGDVEAATAVGDALGEHMADYPEAAIDRFNSALLVTRLWLEGHQDLIYTVLSDRASVPASRAWFAAESGRIDAAAEHLIGVGGVAGIVERSDYMWWHDVVGCSRAVRRLGDVEFAADLYAAVLPYRSSNAVMGLISYLGCAEHHLGSLAVVLDRLDAAVTHFEAALQRYDVLRAVPFTALAEAELASALRLRGRPGDVERAVALRATAAEVADRLGLGTVTAELTADDVRDAR